MTASQEDIQTRERVVAFIKEHLPFGPDADEVIREDSLLTDLGMDSLHLITLLLALQREYGLDIERMTESGMPLRVSDLIVLVSSARVGP